MKIRSCLGITTLSVLILALANNIVAQTPAKMAALKLNFPAGTNQQQVLDGWIGLFDGQTTFGWVASNLQAWKVNPGLVSSALKAKVKPSCFEPRLSLTILSYIWSSKLLQKPTAACSSERIPNPKAPLEIVTKSTSQPPAPTTTPPARSSLEQKPTWTYRPINGTR